MYSPLAAKAMTTETRGQNSWVNYSDAVGDLIETVKIKQKKQYMLIKKSLYYQILLLSEGLAK
jgi:hypothetical protein